MTETGVDATAFETFVRGDLFRAIMRTQHADLFAGTTVGTGTVPTGTITPYAGTLAPESWLLCSGQTVLRSQYSDLYAVISNRFGGVTDGTTFRLPDLRGRVPVGAGTGTGGGVAGVGAPAGGVALTARNLGAYDGDERLQAHTHTGTIGDDTPDHTHTSYADYRLAGGTAANYWFITDGSGTVVGPVSLGSGGANSRHQHPFTGGAHNQLQGANANVQPSVVLNYIIRT